MGDINLTGVTKAYDRWAPIYDLVFGAVFDRGRKAAIAAAEEIGGRILDVGVGTGIALGDYSRKNRIVGVDYAEPMLRKALHRVAEQKLSHVEALAVMDAQRLGFRDAFFDAVVAQFVITAVPDPEATLDEFARVTKPGGEIILVNHLSAEAGLRKAFDRWFSPVARQSQVLRSMACGPICTSAPRIVTPGPRILRATAPAATRDAVSRAEARPPPR